MPSTSENTTTGASTLIESINDAIDTVSSIVTPSTKKKAAVKKTKTSLSSAAKERKAEIQNSYFLLFQ